MLIVYGWSQCPHCRAATAWLKEHHIPFEYREITDQPPEIVADVVAVNGGDDWVVPTLEYKGEWVPGKVFNPTTFAKDLSRIGVTGA